MPAKHAESDALFRTLLATAVDGIVVIDAEGMVHVYNAACERLFGYRSDEVVGRNVRMLMPAPYHDRHDGYLAHYRSTGEKRIIGIGRAVVGRRKDGSDFPMYLSVGEGVLDGQKIYVGIIHDRTSQEEATRRMQELQSELLHVSRLSAMGQMTAALAHELNQPLTAIMNYVKAARRTLAPVGDPLAVRALELMDRAAQQTARAGEIIRHLRDFVEKREAARAPENPNAVVEEAIALGLVGTADSDVKLRIELDRSLPAVLIDKIQIQQVVMNLIRNSVEAMQSVTRRELTISTGWGENGRGENAHGENARGENDSVEIAIADTGPGLAPEVAARLFQPFVTTKEKGMGLGLTICQSIVEAHHGRIRALPNDDGGVTFRFSLPAAP